MYQFSHISRDVQKPKKYSGVFDKGKIAFFLLGAAVVLLVFPSGRAFSLTIPGIPQPSPCSYGEVGPCVVPEPLTLSQNKIYWRNFTDFQNRRLSVDFTINHKTAGYCVNIVGTINTEGVTTESAFPMGVGSLESSGSVPFTIRYHLPEGKVSFKTRVYAEEANACGSYPFPARYPGSF